MNEQFLPALFKLVEQIASPWPARVLIGTVAILVCIAAIYYMLEFSERIVVKLVSPIVWLSRHVNFTKPRFFVSPSSPFDKFILRIIGPLQIRDFAAVVAFLWSILLFDLVLVIAGFGRHILTATFLFAGYAMLVTIWGFRRNFVRMFQDRTTFISQQGGIDRELSKVTEAWVAFESGAHFNTMDSKLRRKITKLVMVGPETELRERLAGALGDSHGTFMAAIRRATDLALQDGLSVRWSSVPIMNSVVGNPQQSDGWARLQAYLPYTEAAHWPSIIVYRRQHPLAYENLVKAYERLWEESTTPEVNEDSTTG
ncbi:MAG: hypothetical protein CMJ45_04500 [Planctomyces sp.]|nr:hypothetical protein [Planctomyces sp.]